MARSGLARTGRRVAALGMAGPRLGRLLRLQPCLLWLRLQSPRYVLGSPACGHGLAVSPGLLTERRLGVPLSVAARHGAGGLAINAEHLPKPPHWS
jgi:hypothetical protein